MLSLNPKEMSERDNYKCLIGSVIPRPIAVVTSMSEERVLNIAPFSYFNIVTANPPIVSISIQRKKNGMKDTVKNILFNKEAVIHIAEERYIEAINETAANLASQESELELTNFTLSSPKEVTVPMLKEMRVKMETVLYQHIPIVQASEVTADLLLLQIKQYHIAEELYNNGRISAEKLNPMSRLAGNDYAKLGDRLTIARPD